MATCANLPPNASITWRPQPPDSKECSSYHTVAIQTYRVPPMGETGSPCRVVEGPPAVQRVAQRWKESPNGVSQGSPENPPSPSAELPSVAAVDAGHKGGHGLISAARLHLVVLALALLALAALELVCRGLLHVLSPLRFRQSRLSDLRVLALARVACQLLRCQIDQHVAC